MHEILFNYQEYQKDIFWQSYKKSEQTKAQNFENLLSVDNKIKNIFIRYIYSCINLINALYTCFVTDREFWDHYLKTTNVINMNVVILNLASLFIFIFAFLVNMNKRADFADHAASTASLAHLAGWLILSLFFLIFFMLYYFSRTPFIQSFKLDLYEIWQNICFFFCCFRFFFMIQGLTYLIFQENETCYGAYLLSTETKGIGYFLFIICMDLYQSFVFSTLPVPSYLVIGLSLILSLENILRVFTCRDRVSEVYHIDHILIFLIFSFSMSLIIFNAVFTITFERSVYSSFINIKNEVQAAKENNKIVNMLCRDIKIPVQTLQRVVLSTKDLFNFHNKKFEAKLQNSSETIYSLIDSTVYLLRVAEKRFSISTNDEVDIYQSINQSIKIFKASSYSKVNFSQLIIPESDPLNIMTDKLCFESLLFYSLQVIFALLGCESFEEILNECTAAFFKKPNSQKFHDSKKTIAPILIKYGFIKRIGINDMKKDTLSMEINWANLMPKLPTYEKYLLETNSSKRKKILIKQMTKARQEIFTAASLICNNIVSAYNGQWNIFHDRITFTCVAAEIQVSGKDLIEENEKLNRLFRSQHFVRFVHTKLSIYLNDPDFEPFILQFLQEAKLFNVPIYRSLNAAELKIHSILFVQSLEACKSVRSKGFEGDVIVCSEQWLYLDKDNEDNLFTQGIPLPCPEREKKMFQRWLRDKYFQLEPKRVVKKDINLNVNIDVVPISIPVQNTSKNYLSNDIQVFFLVFFPLFSQLFQLIKYFIDSFFNLFWTPTNTHPIDKDNYAKWRCLNPGGQLFHHSQVYLIFVLVLVLLDALNSILGVQAFITFIFKTFMFGCLAVYRINSFESFIDKYIGYHRLLSWVGFLVLFCSIALFISELTTFYFHGHHESASGKKIYFELQKPLENCDFNMYLKNKYGSLKGIYTLFAFINYSMNIKGSTSLVAWPYSLPNSMLIFIRLTIVSFLVIKQCFGASIYSTLIFFLTCFTIKILRVTYQIELLYRKEYSNLNVFIQSKDYLEKLYMLTNKCLHNPINRLNSSQSHLINYLVKDTVKKRIVIPKEFLPDLLLLNKNVIITNELIMKINMDFYFNYGRLPENSNILMQGLYEISFSKIENLRSEMKAYFIKDLVEKIASHFEYQTDDLKLKVFCHCDPYLHFIRLDANIFSTLLSDVCRSAVQRIQNARDVNIKDKQHEILIWLQPYDFSTNTCQLPNFKQNHQFAFNDVRLMDVLVLDTGILPGHELPDLPIYSAKVPEFYDVKIKDPENWANAIRNYYTIKPRNLLVIYEDEIHSQKFIGDRYAEFFGFQMKYHQGLMNNYHYHTFQRFGIPFLLCRDSNRITKTRLDSPWGLKIYPLVPHCIKLHEEYNNALENTTFLPAELNFDYYSNFQSVRNMEYYFSDAGSYWSTAEPYSLESLSSLPDPILNLHWTVGVLHYLEGSMMSQSNYMGQLFSAFNWSIRFCYYGLNKLPEFVMKKDCILIEYDPLTPYKTKPDLKELIQLLRIHEYNGPIIVLLNLSNKKPSMFSSTHSVESIATSPPIVLDSENFRAMSTKTFDHNSLPIEYKIFQRNDYIDCEGPDLVVRLPLSHQSVQCIVAHCEQRLMKNMLNSSSYSYN